MPDPNESAEDLAERRAAVEELTSGETSAPSVNNADAVAGDALSPDESLGYRGDLDEAQPQDDVPQMEKPFSPDEEAGPAAADDPYGSLRAFLVELDPTLRGVDWNPVEVAVARLGTQKEYLDRFMVQAGEFRQAAEEQLNEVARLQADLALARDAAAQKDVRDERIGAIVAILDQKTSEKAKVARIRQLLS